MSFNFIIIPRTHARTEPNRTKSALLRNGSSIIKKTFSGKAAQILEQRAQTQQGFKMRHADHQKIPVSPQSAVFSQ